MDVDEIRTFLAIAETGGFTWVREAMPTGDLKKVFRP